MQATTKAWIDRAYQICGAALWIGREGGTGLGVQLGSYACELRDHLASAKEDFAPAEVVFELQAAVNLLPDNAASLARLNGLLSRAARAGERVTACLSVSEVRDRSRRVLLGRRPPWPGHRRPDAVGALRDPRLARGSPGDPPLQRAASVAAAVADAGRAPDRDGR